MAEKKSSPAMEFVIDQLKRDPNVAYKVVLEQATKKGLPVYPIMYGRAKALLGLVPTAPRGSKKKAATARAASAPALVKPALRRPRRAAVAPSSSLSSSSPIESIEQIIVQMREVATERDRFQKALEDIGRIIEEALL